MGLISNHKFNKLQNQLKEQDLLSKKTHLEDLKEVNKVLENFDQIHKKK
jgi:polysaccharide pyruvyl transferase WcaK-like protein